MPSFVASGNISPMRFVKLTTTADGQVTQCGAGDKCYGISQKSTRRAPLDGWDDGFAAIATEVIHVHVEGMDDRGDEVWLKLGGTVAVGDRLKSDASGQGVVTTTPDDEIGAIAMEAGASADLIKVKLKNVQQV